jgi:small-conductance mechanosensitive channel
MDIQPVINLVVFKEFKDRDIQFAYPTRTFFLVKGAEEQEVASVSAKTTAAGESPGR